MSWTILKSPAAQIGVAAVAGVIFGLAVGEWTANLQFIGDMFIRWIQMSIVPLAMASVIVATGSETGWIAFRTFKWMIGFSVIAALLAYGLSALIEPGLGMVFTGQLDSELESEADAALGWQVTLLEFVSKNVFEAMASATMVPIIIFSLLFGIALRQHITRPGTTACCRSWIRSSRSS